MKADDPGCKMFEALGLTLRVFREYAGLSQAELARRARIGKSQLSKYERGKPLPRLEPLGRLIAALETTPLVVFYVSSVIERAHPDSEGLRGELLGQGAETFLRGDQEAHRYRELFDHFLALYEKAVEARVLRVSSRGKREEEP